MLALFIQLMIIPGLFVMKGDSATIEKYRIKKKDLQLSMFNEENNTTM